MNQFKHRIFNINDINEIIFERIHNHMERVASQRNLNDKNDMNVRMQYK